MNDSLIPHGISRKAKSLLLTIGLLISISCIPFPHILTAAGLEDNPSFNRGSGSIELNLNEIMSNPGLLHSKFTELTLQSIKMKKELSRLVMIDGIERQLNDLNSTHIHLKQKLNSMELAPELNRHQLRLLQVELENGFVKISKFLLFFTQLHAEVKPWQNYWDRQDQNLLDLQKQLETGTVPIDVHDSVDELRAVIEEARSALRTTMEPASQIQHKAENLQVAIHQTEYEIFQLFNDTSLAGAPNTPFYSTAFLEQFRMDQWPQAAESIKLTVQPDFRQLIDYKLQVIFTVLLFWGITASIKRVRQIILQTSRWHFLAQHRYSVATLLSLSAQSNA